jgi:hypothetical protein
LATAALDCTCVTVHLANTVHSESQFSAYRPCPTLILTRSLHLDMSRGLSCHEGAHFILLIAPPQYSHLLCFITAINIHFTLAVCVGSAVYPHNLVPYNHFRSEFVCIIGGVSSRKGKEKPKRICKRTEPQF